ncbi:hypothetical protein DSECCO2_552770 [anaerobic digester metagenome]
MKHFVRTFCFVLPGIILMFILSSCQSFRSEQRYKNLLKVAVNARAESDSICHHISEALFSSRVEAILPQDSIADSVSIANVRLEQPNRKAPVFSTAIQVAKEESMRLAQKYTVASSDYRSSGKMAVDDTKIWWLWGVLIFLGAFLLALALMSWISKSDSGCLVIGCWLLFTGLLAWLLLWLIL